jgi:hypothetical protein
LSDFSSWGASLKQTISDTNMSAISGFSSAAGLYHTTDRNSLAQFSGAVGAQQTFADTREREQHESRENDNSDMPSSVATTDDSTITNGRHLNVTA